MTRAPSDPAIPAWASPGADPRWPTRIVESRELGYRLPRPERYERGPLRARTPVDDEDQYLGPEPGEWLSIRCMPRADPGREIGDWVEAFLRLIGVPTLVPDQVPARLVEWRPAASCPALAHRLGVDETRLYTGLARLDVAGGPPCFARLYGVLARRGTWAWKVDLALASACLPGAPAPLVAANDHVRAAASLGALELAVPPGASS